MQKVDFPAVIVCSRWDHRDDCAVAFIGCDPIDSDHELERRLAGFQHFEETGGHSYTYTLAALGDEDRVIAERVAELESAHRFYDRTEPGVSHAPGSQTGDGLANHPPQSSTNGDGRQVSLVVGYEGAFPPPPQTFATGELVSYILDGEPTQPPAHSLAETRLWLKANGFEPDFVRWQAMDRKVPDGERRKRLEVWTGPEVESGSAGSASGWWGAACATERVPAEKLAAWREAADRERGGDRPVVPESGQGWRYRHPYSNY